jgi:putative ABC transport system permease protein
MRFSATRHSGAKSVILALIVMLLALLFAIGCEIFNAVVERGPLAEQTLITYPHGSGEKSLPVSAVSKVADVQGVQNAVGIIGMGGHIGSGQQFIEPMAVGARFLKVQPQVKVTDAARAHWDRDRRGALVGPQIMQAFHLHVGQLVTLHESLPRSDGTRAWEFIVDGVYTAPENVDPFYVLLHYNYVDEGRAGHQGTISYVLSLVREPAMGARVTGELDALFRNSETPTFTQSVASLGQQFASQIGFLRVLLVAIAITAVIIFIGLVLCAYVLEARERLPQLAVLRALGFSRWHICRSAVVDAWLKILPAGLVGLALGVPVSWLARQLQPRFLLYFGLRPADFFYGAIILIVVSISMGILTAWMTTRRSISDTLRRGLAL